MDPNAEGPTLVRTFGRIVHAADLHLGAPLDSLGVRLGEAKAAHLRALASGTFELLVEATINADAEVLVLAGDVYDQADREVAAQVRFARGLARLHDAGVSVFIAHGNHDPLVAHHRLAAALPPNVTVFPPNEPHVHAIPLASGHELLVAGVSFGSQHETANLAQRFHHLPVATPHCVGVLHANVAGCTGHDPYAPCSTEDLAAAPVGYWALGHVHQRTVRAIGPGRWWAYSGNLQGRSAKASECGAKGALVVDVVPDGFAEPRFVACDAVRFQRSEVDVAAAADVGEVLELVAHHVALNASDADGRPLLVRLRLGGATPAHQGLHDAGGALLDMVRREVGGSLDDGDVIGVQLATRPAVERGQLLDRGDLVSALLHRLDHFRAEPAEVATLLHDTVAEFDSTTRGVIAGLAQHDPQFHQMLLERVEQRLVHGLVQS